MTYVDKSHQKPTHWYWQTYSLSIASKIQLQLLVSQSARWTLKELKHIYHPETGITHCCVTPYWPQAQAARPTTAVKRRRHVWMQTDLKVLLCPLKQNKLSAYTCCGLGRKFSHYWKEWQGDDVSCVICEAVESARTRDAGDQHRWRNAGGLTYWDAASRWNSSAGKLTLELQVKVSPSNRLHHLGKCAGKVKYQTSKCEESYESNRITHQCPTATDQCR